jgi:hypothetical protein
MSDDGHSYLARGLCGGEPDAQAKADDNRRQAGESPMNKSISDRIAAAITQANDDASKPEPYPHLEDIIRVLDKMQSNFQAPAHARRKTAGALGRLVLDDISFSESQFGTLLLQLADDFASK